MLIDQITNADALPVLERTIQFAARRQELIAGNIANFSTPNYRPMDVSVADFQATLGDAVDRRRQRFGGPRGELDLASSREVKVTPRSLTLHAGHPTGNVLFHDRNNRDLERTMQQMVENLTAFRVASDLLKSRMDMMNTAIRERV